MAPRRWAEHEDNFISRCVALGLSNPKIHAAFVLEVNEYRSLDAIAKRRSTIQSRGKDVPEADEQIRFDESDEALKVAVVSAGEIKTVDELRVAAEIDLDLWEEHKADVRNRYAPMKDADGQIVVIEIRYIKIEYRRKARSMFDLSPAIIKIAKPRIANSRKSTTDISIHFGDKHIPYDDERHTSILHQIIDITDPSTLVDHGDTLDCEQISRYPKDPFHRVGLKQEIDLGRKHFGELSSLVREGCTKLWFEGNHEQRLHRIVYEMADHRAYGELLTLPEVRAALRWESLLGLDSLGWRGFPYQSDGKRKNFHVLFDKLVLKHGASTGKNSAEKEYNKYGKGGLSGHLHRIEVYSRRDWNGQHQWHVLPMLGSIRDDYVDHANWQAGLMVVSWSPKRDRFGFEPIQIIDGECIFRGMRLVG
jgi:hypothetical protein